MSHETFVVENTPLGPRCAIYHRDSVIPKDEIYQCPIRAGDNRSFNELRDCYENHGRIYETVEQTVQQKENLQSSVKQPEFMRLGETITIGIKEWTFFALAKDALELTEPQAIVKNENEYRVVPILWVIRE